MANLHILRSSGFTHAKLQQCLLTMMPDDSIILIDDGVYNLKHPQLLQLMETTGVYALSEHVLARGIVNTNSKVNMCDYNEFVVLTLAAEKVITWQ